MFKNQNFNFSDSCKLSSILIFIIYHPLHYINTGKDKWAENFPICKDNTPTSRQSPIDIKSDRAKYDSALKPLTMFKYNTANSKKNATLQQRTFHHCRYG